MEIEMAKIGDHGIRFNLWIDFSQLNAIFSDTDGNLQPVARKDCGNTHIVLAPLQDQLLRGRCKIKGWIFWTPVVNNAPEASDRERIAKFISELPNANFIQDLTQLDQIYRWAEWKNECIWIAKCFMAGRGSVDNPLLRPLEEGEIDQYYHDSCWLTVDFYENLWKLIHLKDRRIKAAFNKLEWSFESPRQLLEEIIASEINGEFSNILKPRYEHHVKELKKLAKLAHRSYKGFLSQKDRTELARLKEKHSQPNTWLTRLIDVSRGLAETDEFFQVRVAIHDEIMRGICKLQQDAACKPELRRQGQISEIWIDGAKRIGINNGWRA
ncbi:hypothetical protein H6F96_10150 [Microcoleus sp. FACHB-53]|nr:hypothetical protein [Microcoleus sp. FACHB-53]